MYVSIRDTVYGFKGEDMEKKKPEYSSIGNPSVDGFSPLLALGKVLKNLVRTRAITFLFATTTKSSFETSVNRYSSLFCLWKNKLRYR